MGADYAVALGGRRSAPLFPASRIEGFSLALPGKIPSNLTARFRIAANHPLIRPNSLSSLVAPLAPAEGKARFLEDTA